MNSIKQSAKVFFRTKYLPVCILLIYGYTMYLVLTKHIGVLSNNPVDKIWETNNICIYYFIMFSFVAYEYFSLLKRQNADEVIFFINRKKALKGMFAVLIGIHMILSMGYLAANLVFYNRFSIYQPLLLQQIFENIFFSFFLSGIIGILISYHISRIPNKYISVVVLLLFWILVSPIVEEVKANFGLQESNLFVFAFLPKLKVPLSYGIGFLVQDHRRLLIFLWISFGLYLLIRNGFSKYKKAMDVGFLVCMIVGICMLQQPFTVLYGEGCLSGGWLHYVYYNNSQYQEDAAFQITDYNITIKTGMESAFTTWITLNQGDLEEYHLTLYHEYEVDQVTSQDGTELSFEQNGDYLCIWNTQENLEKLKITYHGTGKPLYAEDEALYLHSDVVFFPIAGYQELFDVEEGVWKKKQLPEASFYVHVDTNQKVYCNLPRVDKNSFQGSADSVLIMFGLYEEMEINGTTIIYNPYEPYEEGAEERVKQFYVELQEMAQEGVLPDTFQEKTLFLTERRVEEMPYMQFFDDYWIISVPYKDSVMFLIEEGAVEIEWE